MRELIDTKEGTEYLFMGNEAIARGALEAGVNVVAAYPGTPASEITERLSKVAHDRNLYVEWSTNEKVALEVAASSSFAELRALCAMKQNGLYVASDFMIHLGYTGIRGGFVIVISDDPGGLSSSNEGESRIFAKTFELPLLEPGDIQEAKDMTKWAFDLSEELKTAVIIRSVTRISHASGNVKIGKLPSTKRTARFRLNESLAGTEMVPLISPPPVPNHARHLKRIEKVKDAFEQCPFNTYKGPDHPQLLIITSSACNLYSKEAINLLNLEDKVGLLKLGTTWPLPEDFLKKHLSAAEKILVVEEVAPFLEESLKIFAWDLAPEIGIKTIHGKGNGMLPKVGELNPDLVAKALSRIFEDFLRTQALPSMKNDLNQTILPSRPQGRGYFAPDVRTGLHFGASIAP